MFIEKSISKSIDIRPEYVIIQQIMSCRLTILIHALYVVCEAYVLRVYE